MLAHARRAQREAPRAGQTATCVRLLVGLEHAGGDEAAPAQLALVGLLARVGPHVLLQVAGLLEALVAMVAPATQRKAQGAAASGVDDKRAGHPMADRRGALGITTLGGPAVTRDQQVLRGLRAGTVSDCLVSFRASEQLLGVVFFTEPLDTDGVLCLSQNHSRVGHVDMWKSRFINPLQNRFYWGYFDSISMQDYVCPQSVWNILKLL